MSGAGFPGCQSCDHGWQYATEEYVASRFPIPPHATEDQIAAVWRKRESYREFVFPCPDCRPDAFQRWANGCWEMGHKARGCELCLEAFGERVASRHDRSPTGASRGGDR